MNVPTMLARPSHWQGLAFCIATCLAGAAGAQTSGATLNVKALPDRFVAADLGFHDLDALEALVAPVKPALLQLDACGAESATSLLAAAARFADMRLELHLLPASDPSCAVALAARVASADAFSSAASGRRAPSTGYWAMVQP